MALRISLLIGMLLVALSAAFALWHDVREATQRHLLPSPVVQVQRSARRYDVLLGVIEGGALIALVIALLNVPSGSTEIWLVGLAALCVALMIGVWVAWLRPLNMTIAGWQQDAPPDDWARHHARWSMLHRLRILIAITALALLLMGLFPRLAA
jgi:hypothetical protein